MHDKEYLFWRIPTVDRKGRTPKQRDWLLELTELPIEQRTAIKEARSGAAILKYRHLFRALGDGEPQGLSPLECRGPGSHQGMVSHPSRLQNRPDHQ